MISLSVLFLLSVLFVRAEGPVDDPIWWYSNETPPNLRISGPAGPLRGQAEAIVRFDPLDRAQVTQVTINGQPIPYAGPRLVVDTATLPDGQQRVEIVARDLSRRENEARALWEFRTDNTGPAIESVVEPPEGPREGKTGVVRVKLSEPAASLQVTLEGRPLPMYEDGQGSYWSIFGIPPDPAYRSLRLLVDARDALGNAARWEKTYPLVRTRFPEEALDFDPTLDYLAEQAIRAQEMARLMKVYEGETGPKRWIGAFRLPVEGIVTTEFATRRSYNGRFAEGNHLGIDYGMPMGALVQAPANGVVVYAAQEPVRGNVLILEHGAGVYSTFAHLQRFEVELGDEVGQGDPIARVGSTGLSTGPHLHWEVWVLGAAVDPADWAKREFP